MRVRLVPFKAGFASAGIADPRVTREPGGYSFVHRSDATKLRKAR